MRVKLSKNVVVLGFVSFFNDVSSEMIAPALPIFLTGTLHASKIVSGSIMGLIESASSIFKVVFGYASDKMRRRKLFVFFGYSLSAVCKAALAFVQTPYQFLILRIGDRTGKGIRTAPRDAIIAESGTETGKSFGFHRTLDTLGAVAGPLLAVVLLSALSLNLRDLFLSSIIPALIGIALLTFVTDTSRGMEKKIGGITALKSRELRIFLLAVLVASLGRYSYAFTIWRAEELGYTLTQSILLYAIFNLIYSIAAYPAGALSDRIGKKIVILAGFILFSLSSLLFAFASHLAMIVAAFGLFGIATAIEDTVPRAYAADIAKDFEKGTIIGAYHTIYGIAVFPASLIVSLIWQQYGLSYGFIYAAAMNVLAALILLIKTRP